MKVTDLKKADVLLKAAADVFRIKYPETDLALLKEKVEECINIINPTREEDVDDEHYDNIVQLNDILDIVKDHDVVRMKENISKFIGGLSWDNFFDDETKKPYSLGSMFYNKLQWACEHYAFIHDEVVEILGAMLETIPAYLNEIELFSNSK